MHEVLGFLCKSVIPRIIAKIADPEKKTSHGPNPAGPIGAWALEAHPAGLSPSAEEAGLEKLGHGAGRGQEGAGQRERTRDE